MPEENNILPDDENPDTTSTSNDPAAEITADIAQETPSLNQENATEPTAELDKDEETDQALQETADSGEGQMEATEVSEDKPAATVHQPSDQTDTPAEPSNTCCPVQAAPI